MNTTIEHIIEAINLSFEEFGPNLGYFVKGMVTGAIEEKSEATGLSKLTISDIWQLEDSKTEIRTPEDYWKVPDCDHLSAKDMFYKARRAYMSPILSLLLAEMIQKQLDEKKDVTLSVHGDLMFVSSVNIAKTNAMFPLYNPFLLHAERPQLNGPLLRNRYPHFWCIIKTSSQRLFHVDPCAFVNDLFSYPSCAFEDRAIGMDARYVIDQELSIEETKTIVQGGCVGLYGDVEDEEGVLGWKVEQYHETYHNLKTKAESLLPTLPEKQEVMEVLLAEEAVKQKFEEETDDQLRKKLEVTDMNVKRDLMIAQALQNHRTNMEPHSLYSNKGTMSVASALVKHKYDCHVTVEKKVIGVPRDTYIKEAERERNIGNKLFVQGHYSVATHHYETAIHHLAGLENVSDLEVPLYSNCAAVNIKMNDPQSAIENCNSALLRDENHDKSHFRRAQAFEKLGQLGHALIDLKHPSLKGNKDAEQAIARITAAMENQANST